MKYRNVTVSGQIATGTSTLSKLLSDELNWKYWSGGEFFRDWMKERDIPLEEKGLTDDEIEREVDYGMRERMQNEQHMIFEAWLSGFVAQGVEGVLKVLLVCKDDLRVDRFVNREGVSVDEALNSMKRREEENYRKWVRLYKKDWHKWLVEPGIVSNNEKIDFWNPTIYDLVIDTYSKSRKQTLDLVLEKLRESEQSS